MLVNDLIYFNMYISGSLMASSPGFQLGMFSKHFQIFDVF